MHIPERILMGPGPSTVSQRVLRALGSPTLGHLDPRYIEIMDETCVKLRKVFQTQNQLTFPVSATGMAGMECVVTNLMEPGDEAIVCVNGVFGSRMVDVMERAGVTVHKLEIEWGRVFTPEQVGEALDRHPGAKALGIVHAETSTGARQPLDSVADIVHDAGGLLLVDCVTSLGGCPIEIDAWGIDAAYSGTQKCLSCPPGLAPVTFSDRAVEVIDKRTHKVASWYLDITMVRNYWSDKSRAYHHTAPINMNYGLHEALRIVLEEGFDARHARHLSNHLALRAGLEALGVDYAVAEEHRLPMLNAVRIPDGVDDKAVRGQLLNQFGIEIGGGLGPLAGKTWRIGLMGEASTPRNVLLFLAALEGCLKAQGHATSPGAGVAAANEAYANG